MTSTSTRTRWACAVAALLAVPATLEAQDTRDTVALPEIVVTATRYPVAPDSVAATITVLRGDDLRAQGIRFVSDALRQVPGIQVVRGGSYGGTTSVFLRGGESDYVKVLLDGVALNQPGGSYDFGSLTIENVERIEILRGPGSVLYGSDAIAGVVQIVTRAGDGGTEVGVRGEGGTFGTARWEVSGLGGDDGFGWSASLGRVTTDGIYDFNNDYRNTVASARLLARAGDRTSINLAGRYADGEFHFPTDFTGAPVDRDQFNTAETTTLSLDLAHRFSHAVEAQLLLGRNASKTGYENQPDPAPGPSGFTSNLDDVERRSVDARAQLRLPAGVRGVAGVSFDHQRLESVSRSDGDFGPSESSFEYDRDNWGMYLQASALPVSRLQLTAGGRLDENERFGSFWTYRASALAFAAATTRFRASVGTGFKEPSFFENFSTGFTTGNPDLRPERTFSLEGGIEQDLAGGLVALSLTGFRQRFRDLIQFTFAPPTPDGPNFFNVAAANASGLEATVQLRPRWPVHGAVSYTRVSTKVTDAGFDSGEAATFVDGERLLRRPTDALTLRAQSAWSGRLGLGAVLTWVGNRDDVLFGAFPEPSRRVTLPSYATLDLSGSFTVLRNRPGSPGLELTARVENLFDEAYEQAANFRSPSRAFFVGLASSVR
ncbi:MAG: TonB-dependent receptor plug domain-containing protein [Gemmatimonadales bacterium]